jgi:hypothetical protein
MPNSYATILKIYNTCWYSAKDWFKKNGYQIHGEINVLPVNKHLVIVESSDTIWCEQWSRKSTSRKTNDLIHIFATLHEKISLDKKAVIEAAISMSYVDAKECIALESVHYDYDPSQHKHPLFHFQCSNRVQCTPEGFDTQCNKREITLDQTALSKRCANMRSPSLFFNLPGLCAMLAADHVNDDEWADFRNKFEEQFEKIPPPDVHQLTEDEDVDPGKLCAWRWYVNNKLYD